MTAVTTHRSTHQDALRAPMPDAQLLARYAQTRDPQLREALVERFLPLARSIAKRYRKAEEPFDDLLQVASLGLLKAIDRFDPEREIAFSSFAVPTIVGELRRHFRDRCWSVRPPRELQERALGVDKYRTELTTRLGRSPSVRELGQALELDDEQVLEALQAQQGMRAASLDAPRGNGDDPGATLADAHGAMDPELTRAEHRATLSTLFQRLDAREQRVLLLRFEQDMTQEQIGQLVGVSQMQVSRIIRGAVAKLAAARGESG
ncbi:MAG TPA: SigB/SigF/SigG family RNA polymerase sigma factor [Baekduia sp.]